MNLTFICASNNEEILKFNFMNSIATLSNEVIVIRDCPNVPKAYNQAMAVATGEILCLVHQDVWLPPFFVEDLQKSLMKVDCMPWGVLGPAGKLGSEYVGFIMDRGRLWGDPQVLPKEVDTLDEMMLIIRKDTFWFDEAMPTHHLIGADLCMQALEAGKKSVAIKAFCHHNSTQERPTLPAEFQLSVSYMVRKWRHRLPINTTCGTLVA